MRTVSKMTTEGEKSCMEIEAGSHRASTAGESDGSVCFSDAEDRSWHSAYNANPEEPCRDSCISDCSIEADLERGVADVKVNVEKSEKDCRICQLNLESNAAECGVPIMLGCSCKDDLGAAHKQCAETWFKIRGNKICEICGSTARNLVSMSETELAEHCNETSNNAIPAAPPIQTRSFWQGHRFLNFLLACMIFAFVISWLFHFNVPG